MTSFINGLSFAFFLLTTALARPNLSDFNWSAIKPSPHLDYAPCYGHYQCARLLVPLDWLDPASNKTVALAIITLPATVEPRHVSFGGTVIANPGGPGSSGILHVLRNGHYLQSMMDGERRFEIMGFDPRGVAQSTPSADCYGSELARAASLWQSQVYTTFGASVPNLKYQRAFAAARGLQCAKTGPEGYVMQEYMATASVAHDMVRIIDEIEALRRKTLTRGIQREGQQVLTSEGTGTEAARLQYHGTSYGTFLGNTFLSMFPGRVKRMVLDGVVVPEDWIDADWYGSVLDSEKALEYFYQTCFEASSTCTLNEPPAQSWHSLRDRINGLINDLEERPRPVLTSNGAEAIVTADMVRSSMFSPLYQPVDTFHGLAELLATAVQGNYTLLLQSAGLEGPGPESGCRGRKPGEYNWHGLASSAVVCGDARDITHLDEQFWQDYFQKLTARATTFGHHVANIPFTCSGWKSRPRYRFTGPFTSPEADPDKIGRPSAPPLFLSSRIDPITPVANAFAASRGHPGSRVLVQRSVGHCALYSAPSECTKRVVRAYMATGALPREGTECEPDCVPWEGCDGERATLPR